MKRLLFAIAGAAAFSAFAADPAAGANDISIVGFENYAVDQGVIGYGDDGNAGGSLWDCAGDDASHVKTLGGDNAAVPSITEPRPFAGETNTKYLALDTNGSELKRYVNAESNLTVAASGTYIDTLVQFTPSESAPGTDDLNGAKLAIWLGVENGVTNLMVRGNFWDAQNDAPSASQQSYILTGTGVDIQPSNWYRLTVKAIGNVLANADYGQLAAFKIQIDGTDMVASVAPLSSAFATLMNGVYDNNPFASQEIGTDIAANKLIPCIQGGLSNSALTLGSVGFKGTGALDDFVVTTEAPEFGSAAIDFSLTWPAGLTAVSYQIGEGEPVAISGTSPFPVPGLAAGDVVKFIVANADGAQKTLTGTAGTDTGLDATGTTFGWPEYLGEAVAGAYEIDDAAELVLFQKGVAAGLTTASTTFKLTDDVTLTAPWPGVGLQNGKDLWSPDSGTSAADVDIATNNYINGAFKGTFDGQNHTISGFQMQGGGLDYCGFFNSIYGATICNLKIAYAAALFAPDTTGSSAESGGTFVGVTGANSTLRNLTTAAGTVSCSKGFGGIVGYLSDGSLVEYCTNNVNMTSLKPNKCGGIAMIVQRGAAVTVRNCQNNGTIAGSNETGSLIGYIGLNVTIADCESTVAYKLMHHQGNTVTVQGTIKGNATVDSYSGQATPGLNFATVGGSVATFVADEALAAGNTYKAMHTATATYEFAAAGSISFDTNLVQAVTFAITAGQGLKAPTETTANGVVTYTAVALAQPTVTVTGGANALAVWTVNGSVVSAPATLTEGDTYSVSFTANQGYEFADGATTTFSGTAGTENITIVAPDATAVQQAGWVDDATTVSNQTAAAAYPALAESALATANAGELTTWAKANSVDFANVVADPADYVDAFLLNCAVADVDAEKEAFKATITVGADGTITVTTPDGKDYNGTLQMKGSNDLSTWTTVEGASSSYHFYKFELGL